RLAGRAIARIAAVVSRRVVLLIPQVIGQLGVHRPLQYPFGQALQQTILPDHVLWLVIVASNSSSNSSRIGFSSVRLFLFLSSAISLSLSFGRRFHRDLEADSSPTPNPFQDSLQFCRPQGLQKPAKERIPRTYAPTRRYSVPCACGRAISDDIAAALSNRALNTCESGNLWTT